MVNINRTGHNSWVLRIFPTRVGDSGRYSCELNTQPNQRLTRLLNVIQEDVPTRDDTVQLNLAHNYTGTHYMVNLIQKTDFIII